MQNIFIKSFLTRIGQSVLLEIFCSTVTQRTRSLGRPVVDCRGLSERNRISRVYTVAELICSQEENPGSSKSPRDIKKLTGISRSSVRRIVGLDDLKDRVCTCWASLDQQFIAKAVDQWRPRLKAVVQVHGGHIEQLFT